MGRDSFRAMFEKMREDPDFKVMNIISTYRGLMRRERKSFIRRLNFEIENKDKYCKAETKANYEKKLYIKKMIPETDIRSIKESKLRDAK